MKTGKKIIISAATTVSILAILLGLLMLSGLSEGYCYFYPSIDTHYAEGYSEKDFSRLSVGMTWEEVNQIMCPPFNTWTNATGLVPVLTNETGLVRVYWTGDGKAPFGDFAWLGRGIELSNGVVTRVVKQIYYD
jgi:hypothetical protein